MGWGLGRSVLVLYILNEMSVRRQDGSEEWALGRVGSWDTLLRTAVGCPGRRDTFKATRKDEVAMVRRAEVCGSCEMPLQSQV